MPPSEIYPMYDNYNACAIAGYLNSITVIQELGPKRVEAAPKIIKTIENPTVNKIIGVKFMFFFSSNSLKELPDIYEM